MSEELAEEEVDRDNLKPSPQFTSQADRNDDEHEGRMRKRSKSYDGTGRDQSPALQEEQERTRER